VTGVPAAFHVAAPDAAAPDAAAAPDGAEAPDAALPGAEPPDGEAEAPDAGAPVDAAALARVSAEPERQDVRALLSSAPGRLERLEPASHFATAPPRRSDYTRPWRTGSCSQEERIL